MSDPTLYDPTETRGYAAVGLYHPQNNVNIGGAIRACGCYGAHMLAVGGSGYSAASTDTFHVAQHMPVLQVDDLHEVVPYDCIPVAVDLLDDAQPITSFSHPERAFYVFGPEGGTLGKNVLDWCATSVYVPTNHCMNLAASVNVILYDRMIGRHAS